jgi:hypothetical protein
VPTVEVSKETSIQYEDTPPADIVSGGSVAGTVKSAWQTDTQVLRVRTNCCWGLLATGAVQFISSTTW